MGVAWLLPSALWLGALAVVPLAVHLLARQRHRPLQFPTLRFIDAAAAPSRRRWHVRELVLLAVRIATVLLIAAALAGPVLVTASRQARWDGAVARAVVTVPALAQDPAVAAAGSRGDGDAVRTFVDPDLHQGLADAAAWLEAHARIRREIVVVAPLSRGSLTPAAVRAVPADIGVRVQRAGAAPAGARERERVQLEGDTLWRVREMVTLGDASTTVREQARVAATDPALVVRNGPGEQAAADAARRAVLRRGMVVPALGGSPSETGRPTPPVTAPWTGDVQALAQFVDAPLMATDGGAEEPQPMTDTDLHGLSRPAAPRGHAAPIDQRDRRAVWALVLVLLAVETWLRRRPA